MKCILLSRISTAQQSIDSQTNDLIKEAERLGYAKNDMIILEDVESAIKLAEHERHGLNQLKRYINEDPTVDMVICWEPSRLARQQKILYSIRDFLVEKQVQLIILNPYVRLLDPKGKLDSTANIVFSLFATISENEMMIKKERMLRARNMLRSQGKIFTGKPLYGYIKDENKKPVPHPEESKIVQYIFNTYLNENISMWQLYRRLMLQGVFKNVKRVTGVSRIQSILRNKNYSSGDGIYPPIVSKELQEACWKKGCEMSAMPKTKTKHLFMLKDVIFCGKCGYKMRGYISGFSYRCVDRIYKNVENPHTLHIGMNYIDDLVWNDVLAVANINSNFHQNNTIIEYNKKISENNKAIENLNEILNGFFEKEDKLVKLYMNDKISEAVYNNQYKALQDEKQSLQNEVMKLQEQNVQYESIVKDNEDYIKKVPINFDDVEDKEAKREIILKYVDKVIINRDDVETRIDIEYKPFLIIPDKGSFYTYTQKGGYIKTYRHNTDGTVDKI